MVALVIGQPEQPLLEDLVLAVPERQRKTQHLVVVADSRQPILSPAIRAGPCLIMREVIPGVAVVAVILPHRPPLPLAQVRAPFAPGRMLFPRLLQARVLMGARHVLVSLSLWAQRCGRSRAMPPSLPSIEVGKTRSTRPDRPPPVRFPRQHVRHFRARTSIERHGLTQSNFCAKNSLTNFCL